MWAVSSITEFTKNCKTVQNAIIKSLTKALFVNKDKKVDQIAYAIWCWKNQLTIQKDLYKLDHYHPVRLQGVHTWNFILIIPQVGLKGEISEEL